ncbi:TetR/AcrR family transcriptional regulator [Lactococcus termiticola]|uniref:TetR family transcriptional regulator n=1 Tax=Lactococcus termiticola TaxID=2169526 RepID=A0A2R5HFP2_9LACT|nr:TetR/AcrR family transcriptional regulator [Lactococcus termiticola]GBG96867.1 TetR family transcriptional regulator [Lactococcus termiticola]
MDKEKNTRRRGEALKNAIFEATMSLLEKEGWEAVTFKTVAEKAETTRSVLYRHWENPESLRYQAVIWSLQNNPDWHGSIRDHEFTGDSLRSDLLDMVAFSRENASLFPEGFINQIFFYQAAEQLFDEIAATNIDIMDKILDRARKRGEIRGDIARAAKLLPFQLFRYNNMTMNRVMTMEELEELVDDVLLPLYLKK